jgi:lipopolysaccharide export system permease protein
MQDFLVIFCLSLAIITFVMSVGGVIKAVDLVARGGSATAILKVFLFNIPYALTFSIPMSILTSVLLLFSRLSIEGEITAMRACGISLWEIISPIIMMSIILSGICLYITGTVAPKLNYRMRQTVLEIGGANPAELLEAGRWIRDFPGYAIHMTERDKDVFKDISIFKVSPSGLEQTIRAKSGTVKINEAGDKFLIDLYDVRIESTEGNSGDEMGDFRTGIADHYPVEIPLDKLIDRARASKKTKEFTIGELVASIRDMPSFFPDQTDEWREHKRMDYILEANERLALGIACFAFALFGIPLGITSRRKESSIGIGISIACVFIFYFFIILADSFAERPELHPELIIWIPVIAAELGGFLLIRRLM